MCKAKIIICAVILSLVLTACEQTEERDVHKINETEDQLAIAQAKAACITPDPVIEFRCILKVDPSDEDARKLLKDAEDQQEACITRPAHLGMTQEQVWNDKCWGKPDHINTTKTEAGNDEQWVFENHGYLYFHNGFLSGIQETK